MKRILTFILVFAIMLSSVVFVPGAAAAEITSDTSSAYISTGGVDYPVSKGDTYTYEYRLNLGKRLTAIDACLSYDTEGLELVSYSFPVLSGNLYSGTYNDSLYFNYSDTSGIAFDSNYSVLVRASFKVIKNGTFDIETHIKDMLSLYFI